MKTKKYLFLMLAAALFAACSNDDDDNSNPTPELEQPSVIDFADYSSAIDQNYSAILRQYGEPSKVYEDFYVYENLNDGKVQTLYFVINLDNQQIYNVIEMFSEDAYEVEDIADYFADKYKMYTKDTVDVYESSHTNVIGSTYVYTFGNTDKEEDATLVITINGNRSVTYSNPKNEPAGPEPDSPIGIVEQMTPNDAIQSFLMRNVADIEEEYPDVFRYTGSMYMVSLYENPYLNAIAFKQVDGVATTVLLLHRGVLDDTIAYFEDLGYTASESESGDVYTFTNGTILITYTVNSKRSEITYIGED